MISLPFWRRPTQPPTSAESPPPAPPALPQPARWQPKPPPRPRKPLSLDLAGTVYFVAYARFSPRPDADDCDSCARQLADARAFGESQGWICAGDFQDEALSGSEFERPGLWAALDALKPGYVLLVRNVDRLARDTKLYLTITIELQKSRARLASVEQGGLIPDDPVGSAIGELMAVIAKMQRLIGNRRTRSRMLSNQASGRRMSDVPPYGTRKGATITIGHDRHGQPITHKQLDPVPAELAIITDWVVPMWEKGWGLRGICRELEQQGIDYRGRRRWHHNSVRKILEREGLIERRPPRKPRRRKKNTPST